MDTAFIFPAFVSDYLGNEEVILKNLGGDLDKKVQLTVNETGISPASLSIHNPGGEDNELAGQLTSYIISCALSDVLKNHGIQARLLAGYSMGLYAALYAGGSVSFVDGVKLIRQAYQLSQEAIHDTECTMGAVIGLTADEVIETIVSNKMSADIANTNSRYSHLISGRRDAVVNTLKLLREKGALKVSVLEVSTPYHTDMIKPVMGKFENYITNNITINDSGFDIVSAINQKLLSSRREIIKEIVNNLHKRINWMGTFDTMLDRGIDKFIECGAGNSLRKISLFAGSGFKVYTIRNIHTFPGF